VHWEWDITITLLQPPWMKVEWIETLGPATNTSTRQFETGGLVRDIRAFECVTGGELRVAVDKSSNKVSWIVHFETNRGSGWKWFQTFEADWVRTIATNSYQINWSWYVRGPQRYTVKIPSGSKVEVTVPYTLRSETVFQIVQFSNEPYQSIGFTFPWTLTYTPPRESEAIITSHRFPDNIVPIIDGYFNNASEWNTTRIERVTPTDKVVYHIGHDDKFLYVLQDFVTDTKVYGSSLRGHPRDQGWVFIDQWHDGGSSPKIDDFVIDIEWMESRNYPFYRNGYFLWTGSGKEWERLGGEAITAFYYSINAKSTLGPSPNSQTPHMIYEYRIPLNFSYQLKAPLNFDEKATFGLRFEVYDHDRQAAVNFPRGSSPGIPDTWADLVFSPLSLPAWSATLAIDEAKTAIERAANEGRTEGLDKARLLLDDASAAFKRGEHDLARRLAEQARDSARRAVFPKIYHEANELLAKARQLKSTAAASTYSSPEAQSLLRQALLAYDAAELSFLRKEFNVAADSARSAIALFEKATLAEQRHKEALEAQRQLPNYIVVGSVLSIGLTAAYILRRKAHPKPQR